MRAGPVDHAQAGRMFDLIAYGADSSVRCCLKHFIIHFPNEVSLFRRFDDLRRDATRLQTNRKELMIYRLRTLLLHIFFEA